MHEDDADQTDEYLYRDDLKRMEADAYEGRLINMLIPGVLLLLIFIGVSKVLPGEFLFPACILLLAAWFWLRNLLDVWAFKRDLKRNL